MVSESSEIIRRLVASGANYQDIGQALGRNRSLIRQVSIGAKPGHNLRASLEELENRLAGAGNVHQAARTATVTAPGKRTTRTGALARVRKPVTIRGNNWTASTVKRSGVKGGARGLGHVLSDAAESGQQVAVTVSVNNSLSVESYGSSRRGVAGRGGSVDFILGDADDVWTAVELLHGGNVTEYVAQALVDQGHVSATGESRADLIDHAAAAVVEIDMRTFS